MDSKTESKLEWGNSAIITHFRFVHVPHETRLSLQVKETQSQNWDKVCNDNKITIHRNVTWSTKFTRRRVVTSIHHSDRYTALGLLDNAAMKRSSASRVDEAWQYHATLLPDCLLGKQTQIVEEGKTLPYLLPAATQSPGDTQFVKPGTLSRCHMCDVLQRTCTNSRSPHYKTIYILNVTFIPLHSVLSPNTLHFDKVTVFSS
jgi:hypothetical protein